MSSNRAPAIGKPSSGQLKHSPDKTSMSKVASVAGGKVDSGAKGSPKMPRRQIDKHL